MTRKPDSRPKRVALDLHDLSLVTWYGPIKPIDFLRVKGVDPARVGEPGPARRWERFKRDLRDMLIPFELGESGRDTHCGVAHRAPLHVDWPEILAWCDRWLEPVVYEEETADEVRKLLK